MRVEGGEKLANIPSGKGVIFAANHASPLDPIVVTAALTPLGRFTPLYYGSRPKGEYSMFPVGKHLYGGALFRAWGAYPVYRKQSNYSLALRHHIWFLKHGRAVCFFPEGGWNADGTKKHARPGIVHLARLGNAVIVPTKIEGVTERNLRVVFGEPFSIDDLERDTTPSAEAIDPAIHLSQKIMDRVYALN
ncbi:MAG: lysophospholipid acyltransferase family protein [Patescibacteria group bacterium]